MRILALFFLLCSTSCGAGTLPWVIAAADRAVAWLAEITEHVDRYESVNPAAAAVVRAHVPTVEAAAKAVRDCGKTAEGTGSNAGCVQSLEQLEAALAQLLSVASPLGIRPQRDPGLLGASGDGVLGVPTPCAVVHGADDARCRAEGARPAPPESATLREMRELIISGDFLLAALRAELAALRAPVARDPGTSGLTEGASVLDGAVPAVMCGPGYAVNSAWTPSNGEPACVESPWSAPALPADPFICGTFAQRSQDAP